MSTINAQNFGDGTDSVPASAVLEGTAKAWGTVDASFTLLESYNITSVTDDGTGLFSLNVTNAFASSIVNWGNTGCCIGGIEFYRIRSAASDASTIGGSCYDPNNNAQDIGATGMVHGDLA